MNSQLVSIIFAVILIVSLPVEGDGDQKMELSEISAELEFEESDNNEPEFNEYEIPTRSNQFGKIDIGDNDDLKDFIVEHGFNGSGSVEDPYVIDDLMIKDEYEGPIISIKWISLHLIMRNITAQNDDFDNVNSFVSVEYCSNITFEGLYLDCWYNDGLYIENSNKIQIRHSHIRANRGTGLKLYGSRNVTTNNCTISGYPRSVIMDESGDVTLDLVTSLSPNLVLNSEGINISSCYPLGTNNNGFEFINCNKINIDQVQMTYLTVKNGCDVGIASAQIRSDANFVEVIDLNLENNTMLMADTRIDLCENISIRATSFVSIDVEDSDNITITDCTNTSQYGSLSGIRVRYSTLVNISNNKLSFVYFTSVTDLYCINNHLDSSEMDDLDHTTAIYLYKVEGGHINENTIDNHLVGISLSDSYSILCLNNLVLNCLYGIHSTNNYHGEPNLIMDNLIRNSIDTAIYFYNTYDRIYRNEMEGRGIFIDTSSYYCTVPTRADVSSNNTLDGIPILWLNDVDLNGTIFEGSRSQYVLINVRNGTFQNISLIDSFQGIAMVNCDNLTFNDLEVINSGSYGLNIRGSKDLTFDGINLINTGSMPFFITISERVLFYHSNFTSAGEKTTIYEGKTLRMIGCSFTSNGPLLFQGSGIYFKENMLEINDEYGLWIFSSTDIVLHGNEFIGCGICFDGRNNLWTSMEIPENNTVDGNPILYISDQDLEGSEIDISEKGMLILLNVQNAVISDQLIDERPHFFSFLDSNEITFDNMSFQGCGMPIRALNTGGLNITNCDFTNCGEALNSQWHKGSFDLSNNSVIDTDSGFLIDKWQGGNGKICDNEILRCNQPINIDYHGGVQVVNNSIHSSNFTIIDNFGNDIMGGIGMEIVCSYSTIVGNDISGFHTGYSLNGYGLDIQKNVAHNNSNTGFLIWGLYQTIVDNIACDSGGSGFHLANVDYSIVSANLVWNCSGTGILLGNSCDYAKVVENQISSCGTGIDLTYWYEFVNDDNEISRNVIRDCVDVGIRIADNCSKIYENELWNCGFSCTWIPEFSRRWTRQIEISSNNTVNGKPLFYRQNDPDLIASGNWGQVLFFNSSGIVKDIEFSNCGIAIIGILADKVQVENVRISNATKGMYFDQIDILNITRSVVTGSITGIEVRESLLNLSNCVLSGNDIGFSSSGLKYSYHGYYGVSNVISFNSFADNGIGSRISYSHSSEVQIKNNDIMRNGIGMMLFADIDLISNNFHYNLGPALILESRSEGLIYRNSFIENNLQSDLGQVVDNRTYSSHHETYWYIPSPKVGNHWSDHLGPDEDNDLVVDVPQEIRAANGTVVSYDLYPIISFDELLPPGEFKAFSYDIGEVTLSWISRFSWNEIDIYSYRIYRGISVDNLSVVDEIDHSNFNMDQTYEYTDSPPDSELLYHYSMTSFKGDRESRFVTIVSVKPDGDPGFMEITAPLEGEIYLVSDLNVDWEMKDGLGNISMIHYGTYNYYDDMDPTHWFTLPDSPPLTIENLTEGQNYLVIKVRLYNGKEYQLKTGFCIDLSPPGISSISPEEGSIIGGSSVKVSWGPYDSGSGIDRSLIKLDNGDPIDLSLHNLTNTWEFFNVSAGQHTFTIKLIDRAGRIFERSTNFTYDPSPCVFQFISPGSDSYLNTTDVMIKWKEIGNWSDLQGIDIVVVLNGMTRFDISNQIDLLNHSILLEDLPDGHISLSLRTHDVIGNFFSDQLNFTVDTRSPDVRLISDRDGLPLRPTIEFRFSEEMNRTAIEIEMDIQYFKMVWEGKTLFLVSEIKLDPGTEFSFSINGTDRAGNKLIENGHTFKVTNKGFLRFNITANGTGEGLISDITLERVDGLDVRVYKTDFFNELLSHGAWNLTIMKDGYQTYEITIFVEAEKVLDIGDINLEKMEDEKPHDPDAVEGDDMRDICMISFAIILLIFLCVISLGLMVKFKRHQDEIENDAYQSAEE